MNGFKNLVLGIALYTIGSFSVAAPAGEASGKSPAPGEYQIRNVKHDLLLRPEDAKKADGTPMVLYPSTNWKCLVWKLDPMKDSGYRPQNLFSGKTFAARQQAQDAGTTAVVQVALPESASAQPAWSFVKESDGYYRISDKQSGQALTANATDDDEVEIQLSPWSGKEEQKWELLPAPEKLDM